jgi:thioredoxin 1
MSDTIPTLTAADLKAVLDSGNPALLLFSRGNDLRNEFSIAFTNAIAEHEDIVFGQINPDDHPEVAESFDIGSRPVMIAYYKGEELVRRSRPWGTDIPLALEMLQNVLPNVQEDEDAESTQSQPKKETPIVDTKPVVVTDQTFQEEVIDHELPTVIDFWAPWCGPCRMVAPILEKLAEEFAGQIRVAKVNVDENPGLAQTFQVMSIPTIMLIKERTIVFSQPGALPEPAVRDLIQQLIALEIPEEAKQHAHEQEPATD